MNTGLWCMVLFRVGGRMEMVIARNREGTWQRCVVHMCCNLDGRKRDVGWVSFPSWSRRRGGANQRINNVYLHTKQYKHAIIIKFMQCIFSPLHNLKVYLRSIRKKTLYFMFFFSVEPNFYFRRIIYIYFPCYFYCLMVLNINI